MKSYKCHKVVKAFKIASIFPEPENYGFKINGFGPHDGYLVNEETMLNRKFEVNGYYVIYEDGYVSYSPADVFEAGYSEIVDGVVKDKELSLGPDIGGISDTGGPQVGLRAASETTRIAVVGLASDRVDGVTNERNGRHTHPMPPME